MNWGLAYAVAATVMIIGALLLIGYLQDRQKEDSETWDNDMGDPKAFADSRFKIELPTLEPQHYCLIPDVPCWDTENSPNRDKLFYFDYFCDGEKKPGDRNPVGTLTLYIDFNNNNRIDDGCEAMWSLYEPVYKIMRNHDSNKDGIINSQDDIWPKVKMTDWDISFTTEELGYEYFIVGTEDDPMGWVEFEDDYVGIGIYANGEEGYEKDEAYYEAIASGWEPIKVSDSHLRINSINDCAAYQEEYGCIRSYGILLGYWEQVTPEPQFPWILVSLIVMLGVLGFIMYLIFRRIIFK